MLNIQVDEAEVRKLYLDELKEHIKKIDAELLFWDTKDLTNKTRMCMNTIQKEFFYHPDFPKRKVGSKWYFPVEKTKAFLIDWLMEQGNK